MRYLFLLIVLLNFGCKGSLTDKKSYFDKDHSPYLGMPQLFLTSLVEADHQAVTLRWEKSEGADHYIVKYRLPDEQWTIASMAGASPFKINGLQNNKSYQFRVVAKNILGETFSNVLTMSTVSSSAAPRIATIALPNFNEGVEEIITLPYVNPGVDMATACEAIDLANVQITRSCQCDVAGVCTVGITGDDQHTGGASFRYRIMIGDFSSGYETVWFTLNAVNDAPVISAINNVTINEDGQHGLAFTIADPDSTIECTSSFLLASTSNASLLPLNRITFSGTAPNCSATFIPLSDSSGVSSMTLAVSDGFLTSTSNSFSFTVDAVNDAPTMGALAAASTAEDVLKVVGFSIADIDSTLTCAGSVTALSSNLGLVDPANIIISGTAPNCSATITPSLFQNGTTQISFAVSDGQLSTSRSFNFSVTSVNNPPTLSVISNESALEDWAKTINFTLTDVDSAVSCSSSYLSASSSNVLLLLESDVVFSGTVPNCSATLTSLSNKFGTTNVSISATDGTNVATALPFTFTVTPVNDRPTISTVLPQSTLQEVVKNVSFTITDIDSTISCANVLAASSNTTLIADADIIISGTFPNCSAALTPAVSQSGAATITLTVTDGSLSATSIFSFSVIAVNAAPTLSNIVLPSITEDESGVATFTVADADTTLNCSSTYLSATSSNASLLTVSDVTFGGTYPNCTATLNPLENMFGTTNLVLTVNDGQATSSTSALAINVTSLADAPQISTISSQSFNQGQSKAVGFTISDVDSTLTCASVSASSSNTNVLANSDIVITGAFPNCVATLTPPALKNGNLSVTLTVTDGALSSSSIFPISIIPVNAAPTISTLLNEIMTEDNSTSINFIIDDVDSNISCSASYLSAASSNVTLILETDVIFSGAYPNCVATINPLAQGHGYSNITFSVTDGLMSTTSNPFRLEVTAVNDAPIISPILAQAINQDTAATVNFTITDLDNALTCASVAKASSATSILANSAVVITGTAPSCSATITPTAGKSGPVDVTFSVSDGLLTSSSVFSLAINAVNAAPTIAAISDTSTSEDNYVTLNLTVADSDSTLACNSSHLNVISSNVALIDPASATFAGTVPNCTVDLHPTANISGSAVVSVAVSDGVESIATNSITLTVAAVDDAPVITPVATQNWTLNQSSSVAFTMHDVDTTISCLTSMSALSSDHSVVKVTSVEFSGTAPNCIATITPEFNQVGPVNISLVVTSGGHNVSTSFDMTFGATVIAPIAADITPAAFNEDVQSLITLSYNSNDAIASACFITSPGHVTVTQPCSCDHLGVCTVGVTGTANYHGAASFSYQVSANSFISNSANANFSLNAVEDAPTISAILAQSTLEDAAKTISFTVADIDTILSCASSVTLTSSDYSLVDPSDAVISGAAPNCQVVITPKSTKNGQASLSLIASDGALSAASAFNLLVSPVNNAPTILSISAQSSIEDQVKTVNFTIADVDNTITCSNSLSASSSATGIVPVAGIIFGGTYPNCTATITPASHAFGAANLSFTVSDSALSTAQSFALTVSAVNDAPNISTVAAQSTPEYTNKAVAFTISDVDNNLSCAANVTATSSNTSLVADSAAVITGTVPNCVVTLSPTLYQNGQANITLVLSDGSLNDQSVFALTVTPVNHAPTIATISAQSSNEDALKTVAFTLSDEDSLVNCIANVTAHSSETSVVADEGLVFGGIYPNCTVAITPVADASGTTTITLEATDGALTSLQTFTLAVSAVNDAPVVGVISPQATLESTSKNVNFTVTDIDSTITCAGNITASSSNVALVPSAGIIINGTVPNCTAAISPVAHAFGSTVITLTASDGVASSQKIIAFNVTALNDAPTLATVAGQSTNEDTLKTVAFMINDIDSTLTCAGSVVATSSLQSLVTNAKIIITGTYPNCSAAITPEDNAIGTADITMTVTDGALSNSQTFILTVAPVADAPELSTIAAQSTLESTIKIVTFTLADVDTAMTCAGNVTATSSNVSMVSSAGIVISGSAPNCVATITPVQYQNGTTSITIIANDGALSAQSAFALNVAPVNNAPAINFIANQTMNEDLASVLNFTVSDVDSTIACTSSFLSVSSSNTTLILATDVIFGGTYPNCTATINALPNQNGPSNITLTLTDGTDTATSNSFQMTVAPVNDAPVSSTIMAQSTDEDTAKAVNFVIGDIDSTLTCAGSVTASSSDSSLIANSGIAVTGSFPNCVATITPVANKIGHVTISLLTSDGILSSTSSFLLTIHNLNDAPTMNVIAGQTTNEDSGIIVPVLIEDIDGPLSCSVRVAGASSNTTLVANSNIVMGGTYPNCTATMTPSPNQNGSANITLTVSDGLLSAARTFNLTVTPVDDDPVSTNITSVTINEDAQALVTLPYTDLDADLASSCSVTNPANISVTTPCSCAAGICTVGVTGTANYFGAAGFSFSVTANNIVSNISTANFVISAVNDAPSVSTISAQSTNEDSSLVVPFTMADVDNSLTCSSNVAVATSDATKVPVSSVVISGTAPNCLATIAPVANANGNLSLTLTASDGTLTSQRSFALSILSVIDIGGSLNMSGVADVNYAKKLAFTSITVDETVSSSEFCISEDSDLSGSISVGEKCNTQTWFDATSAVGSSGTSSTSGWTNYVIKNGVDGASFIQTLAPSCSTTRNYFLHMKLTNASQGISTEIASSSFNFWSPKCLGNTLGIWLDANDTSTMFTNTGCTTKVSGSTGSVACWQDKSSNAYLFNTTATTAPTYKSGTWSGSRPTVTFNGNDLRKNAINITPKNIFAAINVIGTNAFDGFIGAAGNDIGVRINGTNGWISDVLNVGGDFVYSGLGGTSGNTHINGTAGATYVTAAEQLFSQSKGTGSLTTWSNLSFGGYYEFLGAPGRRINANISEVFICVSDCSTSRTKFEGYMAHKWGLTSNLPTGHAYKISPP